MTTIEPSELVNATGGGAAACAADVGVGATLLGVAGLGLGVLYPRLGKVVGAGAGAFLGGRVALESPNCLGPLPTRGLHSASAPSR
jgi:hypothetical protein